MKITLDRLVICRSCNLSEYDLQMNVQHFVKEGNASTTPENTMPENCACVKVEHAQYGTELIHHSFSYDKLTRELIHHELIHHATPGQI